MAAPILTFVRLPDDTGNTGKKARTQSRVVGSDTVHEHYFISLSKRSKLGIFHYSPVLQSVQASAQDGTTTGFFWLQNPAASGLDLVIRQLALRWSLAANTACPTAPRILLVKFTFTGTPSGATVTPAKRKTSVDAANVGTMRTAVTGMTPTLGATLASFLVPAMAAAGQTFTPPDQCWPLSLDPVEDDDVMLEPGEGAVLYQPDAGTASDPRRFTVDLRAEEVER